MWSLEAACGNERNCFPFVLTESAFSSVLQEKRQTSLSILNLTPVTVEMSFKELLLEEAGYHGGVRKSLR